MTINTWLIIALTFSIAINMILLWFAIEQSKKIIYASENLDDLLELISAYKDHLKIIYESEMFYGDESLKTLLNHTNILKTILEDQYGDIINITEPLEMPEEPLENAEKNTQEEKNVLYAGSRKRDP